MNSKMLFYVLKRVLLALLTIWIVITVTFFVMHSIPGGPFASEKAISAEAQAALEAKYGLDKPLGEQYVTYLRDVVTKLDFGPSLKQRGRQVIDIILDGMKTSAKLGLIAAFSAAIVGIVLGALAALRRNTVLDKIIMVITTAFVSMPSFIMGSFLLIVFSVKLGWVPANGATAEGLILPIITLALYPMSYITRLTRSSMLDVLGQDYIRTAQRQGRFGQENYLRSRAEELADSGYHLFRPACWRSSSPARWSSSRFSPCRGIGRQFVIQHHQPRLHHDYGDDYFPRLFNRDYESDQRPALQGG